MNNYHLIVKFGDQILPLTTDTLDELTIVQDYNKFLPELLLRVNDYTGILTHVLPFDKSMSSVHIEFGENPESENKNSFDFSVYRRKPESDQSSPSTQYEIVGLLDINGLFSPDYCRGFNQNIKTTIENIAKNELKISQTEVGNSLNYNKNLLQPYWSNVHFLKYLKDKLLGKNDEACYKCFVKQYKQKSIFVFNSVVEMIKEPVQYKFILNDKGYEDNYPIFDYSIFDNYKIFGVFSSKKQRYNYFNCSSGLVEPSLEANNLVSLTDYFMIDKSDSEDSVSVCTMGRNNEFTSDFKGEMLGSYYNRMVNLSKMWITTIGMPSITPGKIVQIFFPHGAGSRGIYSYQYSGYWLVERVVHNLGDTFLTKLLLTRNGIDTDLSNSLLPAANRKKS